ncbi:SDR family oxidoreductase [Anatilimnocola floriformis]|uniref:SDR family oxidoreductase n=1 Tax=Anatilimnocola floriformis TaxID=2948575 RepID=UPI0020C366F2|nr:SDR family oxidoreductase [Anatilimnocola floriformis]
MPAKTQQKQAIHPAQHQNRRPGIEAKMKPLPQADRPANAGTGKLHDQVAIITGGDSGIGRAVAIAFAREGAKVVVMYLDEHEDAQETERLINDLGRDCLLIAGDIGKESICQRAVNATIKKFGRIDIIVNNAAEQHPQKSIADITAEQLERTFRTNIFGMFFLTKAALPHLQEGARIINTTSVTAYRGSPELLDYSSTKGAIVTFTRSLAMQLVDKGIRVNGVAPGPIWTPLIPSTFPRDKVQKFGSDVPMARAGEPAEVASCFVFFATEASSYLTGQVLHPNGGEIVNG